jgi:hypothetical protein
MHSVTVDFVASTCGVRQDSRTPESVPHSCHNERINDKHSTPQKKLKSTLNTYPLCLALGCRHFQEFTAIMISARSQVHPCRGAEKVTRANHVYSCSSSNRLRA